MVMANDQEHGTGQALWGDAGFVHCFGLQIQGLFKNFKVHIFHFSRTPRTVKSKDVQLLIVAIVPS